jgi:hypothetical protein
LLPQISHFNLYMKIYGNQFDATVYHVMVVSFYKVDGPSEDGLLKNRNM